MWNIMELLKYWKCWDYGNQETLDNDLMNLENKDLLRKMELNDISVNWLKCNWGYYIRGVLVIWTLLLEK